MLVQQNGIFKKEMCKVNSPTRLTRADIGLGLGLVAFGFSFAIASQPGFLFVGVPCAITGIAVSVSALIKQRRAGASTKVAMVGLAVNLIALVAIVVSFVLFLWALSQVDWGPPAAEVIQALETSAPLSSTLQNATDRVGPRRPGGAASWWAMPRPWACSPVSTGGHRELARRPRGVLDYAAVGQIVQNCSDKIYYVRSSFRTFAHEVASAFDFARYRKTPSLLLVALLGVLVATAGWTLDHLPREGPPPSTRWRWPAAPLTALCWTWWR